MVSDVRFMNSEEDLASGPGTRLDHLRALEQQSFIRIQKGTEKASDIDIRKEMQSAPLASVSKGVIYIFKLVITINQKNISRL